MNYKVQAQQNFLQLEYQKVESKLRTYEEVKSDNADLQANPSEWCSCSALPIWS